MGVTDSDSAVVGEETGCWLQVEDQLAVAERDTEPRMGIGTEFLNPETAVTRDHPLKDENLHV